MSIQNGQAKLTVNQKKKLTFETFDTALFFYPVRKHSLGPVHFHSWRRRSEDRARESERLEASFGVQVSGLICLEFHQIRSIFVQHSLNGVKSVIHTHTKDNQDTHKGLSIHSGSFGNFIRGTIQGQTWQLSRDEVVETLGEDRLGCKHEERQVLRSITGTMY